MTIVRIVIVLSLVFLGRPSPAADSGVLLPIGAEPPKDSGGFSVSTHKAKRKKQQEAKSIYLIDPQPEAQFTPGVIKFSWGMGSEVKEGSVTLVLENLDTRRVVSKDFKTKEASLDLKRGAYRWQLISSDTKIKSPWRSFEVLAPTFENGSSPIALKNVPEMKLEELMSEHAVPDVAQHKEKKSENDEANSEDYDEKMAQAEEQADELEKQLKKSQAEAMRALQSVKEQQARLNQIRLEKIKEEKLARERLAQLEANRKAEKEKNAKLRAKLFKDVEIAKINAAKATKKFQIKLQEARQAKNEADRASNELALKTQAVNQFLAKSNSQSGTQRNPAGTSNSQHQPLDESGN